MFVYIRVFVCEYVRVRTCVRVFVCVRVCVSVHEMIELRTFHFCTYNYKKYY